ncbi:MAG: FAD-binding protein [Zavarzinia sp.]|nr:FAD-binding protein [Zavarzinia sp.]
MVDAVEPLDMAVIGAGFAGLNAASIARQAGLRVAVVEVR